jgi:hypothetical protein
MKIIALTLFAAALACAQSQPNPPIIRPAKNKKSAQPAKQSPDQKAKAQTQTQSIPPGAKQVEPNLYRYTDSSGKTWNYRQTPFGISKWEETSAPAHPAPEATPQSTPAKSVPVVVTDQGDSYRFEKKTPFGQSSWTRKKSELTDEEKALAGDQQTQSDRNRNNVNSKAAGNQ